LVVGGESNEVQALVCQGTLQTLVASASHFVAVALLRLAQGIDCALAGFTSVFTDHRDPVSIARVNGDGGGVVPSGPPTIDAAPIEPLEVCPLHVFAPPRVEPQGASVGELDTALIVGVDRDGGGVLHGVSLVVM
jgi:hypothetical protein